MSTLALGCALLIAPASASAVVGLSVSGQVFGTSGGTSSPADNVTVTLFGNDGLQHGQVITAGAGLYTFASVTPGRYQLHFSPADSSPLAPVWLGDSPLREASSYISVTATSLSGLDATLPEEGSISGTVTYDPGVTSGNKTARATAFLYNEWTATFQAAGDPVAVGSNGAYSIRHLNAGAYAVRFDGAGLNALSPVYWSNGAPLLQLAEGIAVNEGQDTPGIDQLVVPGALQTVRMEGGDRFATAVAISERLVPDAGVGIDTLWIANGLGFPDALSAGPAAASQGAPLLLITQNQIPSSVLTEIQRLKPNQIYVAGGEGVVSAAVFGQLNALAKDRAIRLGGANRYETSRLIVSEAFRDYGAWTVTFADGRNYPDALAAGPAVSKFYGPVVLIDGSASTPDAATRQLLSGLNTASITLAGGTGVISSKLEQSLRATAGIVEVIRDGGANRYETANAVNGRAFASADIVFLATGAGFADALAGGAAAGTVWAPLFLVQKDCIPQTTMDLIVSLRPKVIFLLGGAGVLSSAVDNLAVCGGGSGFSRTVLETSLSQGGGVEVPSDLLQQLRSANKWPVQPVSRPSGR
ncbi:MAG TPA: cell wall-binding repeat-containing protein [Terrimesophilobacter sp.]|uniref:cell wall-binding repeat-containing protein n=1 Tax=Terrimesophilobacter sp. TaxID=2906435 RepID=UPI002F94571A